LNVGPWTHLPNGMTQLPTAQFNTLIGGAVAAGIVGTVGVRANLRQSSIRTTGQQPLPAGQMPAGTTQARKRKSRAKAAQPPTY
jgi:hypothetical protein